MEQKLNIDGFVNYQKEYRLRLKEVKVSGNQLTSLCPFHEDTVPSFSVDLKKGVYKCFSCGAEGNYIKFRAELDGIDTTEAYKRILSEHGAGRKAEPPSYKLEEYALEKRLPVEWLKTYCRLEAKKDRDGTGYIYIPYLDRDGVRQVFRKRYPKGSGIRFKWGNGSAGKLLMYGEWLLSDIYERGKVILCEGESDSQTLWFLGLPALGVPGASVYRAEWTERIGDVGSLYLHIEPDQGGQTFLATMAKKLHDGCYGGEVYTWSCRQFGVKDPSELYLKYGKDKARELILSALNGAEKINLAALNIPAAIEDAPVRLRQPEGWAYSENGISFIDGRTLIPRIVCRCPVIITQRLRAIDTNEEKVEISFKRDGAWTSAVFLRSMVFQARNIVNLADMGCTITSENAKQLVSFLSALEAENFDVLAPVDSTSTFGWQPGGRFIPGQAGGIRLDVPLSMQRWAGGYSTKGTLESWVEQTRAARENNYRFRFILSASFAAPLLKLVQCRNFFVYNWADSKSGKTAALKAALSVWGDPERLMVSFNATQVALERMAGIFSDLPLGLDERQLAGSKQEFIEKVVYMLAGGQGRARGAKSGELQTMHTWRSIIIATGEEPIVDYRSQNGVNTRMVEIIGPPFDDEEEAAAMHRSSCANFGLAGPAFIRHILRLKKKAVNDIYLRVFETVKGIGSGVDSNRLNYVALIATADFIIDGLFYHPDQSEEDWLALATVMADEILGDVAANDVPDVNDSARDYIADWINQKQRNFDINSKQDFYGVIDRGVAYVLPSILKAALEEGGYNYRKTIKGLAEKGIIRRDSQGRYATLKRIESQVIRVVAIDLEKLTDGSPQMDNLFGYEMVDSEIPF